MENLAPNLRLAIAIRLQLEQGNSIRQALRNQIQVESGDWAHRLMALVRDLEMQRPLQLNGLLAETQALLQLIERGWKGEAILESVCALEEEIFRQNELQIDHFAAQLPIKLLVPLLMLQFPAFLILILGPLLSRFMSNF